MSRHTCRSAPANPRSASDAAQASEAATAAQQDFDRFVEEYGDLLKSTETEAKANSLVV